MKPTDRKILASAVATAAILIAVSLHRTDSSVAIAMTSIVGLWSFMAGHASGKGKS